VATDRFAYVQEENAPFLSLFPHRYDFIYAEHPPTGDRPHWQTERRYPLSDRLIQQGNYLYGVRFGRETRYCLLDIDAGSPYHPRHDPFAIARITAALEPLGLVAALICTSSYSGGLHLYFPLQTPYSSWQIATVVSHLLEKGGFPPVPGQLEVFPNPKPYTPEGTISLFNAHRLPLQAGSYLLDADFQPVWSDPHRFSAQWHHCLQRNDVRPRTLQSLLKQFRPGYTRLSRRADQFLQDLNAEIDQGWTGHGQTNRLLGRIALRCYVFHHVLHGGQPLTSEALVQEIVVTARSLPGFHDWCRHQADLEERATEWARCVEASRYFPYGYGRQKTEPAQLDAKPAPVGESWNQRQAAGTQSKIQTAVADLIQKNALPAGPTARFKALLKYGIGGGSLYRYRPLWHPDQLTSDKISELKESFDRACDRTCDQEKHENLDIDIDIDIDPDTEVITEIWKWKKNENPDPANPDTEVTEVITELKNENDLDTKVTEITKTGSKPELDLLELDPDSLELFKIEDRSSNSNPAQIVPYPQLPLHYLPSLLAHQGGNADPVCHRGDRSLVIPAWSDGNPHQQPDPADPADPMGQLIWLGKDLSKVGCLDDVLSNQLGYGVGLDDLSLHPWLWWIKAQDGAS